MDMRIYVEQQSELAIAFAKDGGYASAARVLEQTAAALRRHVKRVNDEMAREFREKFE